MKPVWQVAVAVVMVNALALLGVLGWLGATGRLSRDRARQVVDTFRLTVAQQKAEEEKAALLRAQAQRQAEDLARLEMVESGPVTLNQRLRAQEQADEVAAQRYERMRREQQDLVRRLEQARQLLANERAELDAQRRAFEELKRQREALASDADFQQTVQMYESVQPRQAKQMFQTLMGQGRTEQVVLYLSAMQLRKAAAVLQEFKQPEEIPQATDLLERLRARGIDPSGSTEAAASGTSASG